MAHHSDTHCNSHDFTEANRTFFDDLAAKYDIKPWQKQLSLQVTNYIQQNLAFIHPQLSTPSTGLALLDYACGTGMISRALGPSVASVTALDLSTKMVERFNELAEQSEIASVHKAHALVGNLLTDKELPAELTGPELHDFDVAAVGLGVHHFKDPASAIGILAQRLKVRGVLLIVDIVEEEETWLPSGAEHTIHKHGFSEEEMRGMMERKGLGEFGWREMPERVEMVVKEEKSVYRKIFLARAVRLE